MAYKSGAVRRGGATPAMAACRRHPQGWGDGHRRAAWLVARVLVCEYATLLAPCAVCPSAQRGRGGFWNAL